MIAKDQVLIVSDTLHALVAAEEPLVLALNQELLHQDNINFQLSCQQISGQPWPLPQVLH